MKRSYQAVFIVPTGASKVLGDYGWEFNSLERLPESIGEYLVGCLGLKFEEEYAGIKKYTNGQINMSIFLDDNNEVESIYFQAFESFLAEIYKACQNEAVFSGAEIFISEELKSL
ncbi:MULTISPECIES: hypothetical protein [Pseudomonas]|nr:MULTISPECIES: hypothetical protein [Pseudomonas]MCA5965921.1 hypothetical protein [Pseudomonas sp. P129]MCA5973505.1 hypothetical protein [Pseudomonas sp. P135]MCH5489665.1 hypothetical protein [Pseudomonas syringae pv. syringae]MCH5511824.1 hypothetical protein [Pseudomonas syringae pv. syringae]MCH5536216.1 hypothetical protein [Pseudomonas syringae pv. syringae]